MTTDFPLALGIDETTNQLTMRVKSAEGIEVKASISENDIPRFMAMLSHCQHALTLAKVGNAVSLPLDPNVIFEEPGNYALTTFEGVSRFSVGIDDAGGMTGLTVLSSAQRLSSYRMSPDMARKMGAALIRAADQTSGPQRAS